MKKYVLGIDGGNTKADYMLFDNDGNLLNHIRTGSCSHEVLPGGFEEVRTVMASVIEELLSPHGLTVRDVSGSAMGLAGVDFEWQKNKLEEVVASIGIQNFVVANDSFLGLKAAATNGYGVCSINGTGTVAGGIDPTGRSLQVGGIGLVFGDEAGGGYIADMAVRLCYDYFYRCGSQTLLADKLPVLFGITDKSQLADRWVHRDRRQLTDLQVCQALFAAADEGDAVSRAFLEKTGRELAASTAGCINNLSFGSEVEVILAGSVWIKAETPYILNGFKRAMAEWTDKTCRFIRLEEPPAAGAALWAYELSEGTFPDARIKDKILSQTR